MFRRVSVTAATTTIALVVAAAGCVFEAPGYDDTRYACAAAAPLCPPGYACQDGWCVPDDRSPEPPDALGPDGAVAPPPDAVPDAPPAAVTASFGERGDADHHGVTIDATIHSDDPTANVGGLDFLEIDAGPIKSALMRFDLSAIPTGATVLAASLEVVVFDPIETGAFRLHPLTEDWSETGATFVERLPGVLWTGPGAVTPSSDPTRVLAEIEARAIEPVTLPLDPAVVQGWVAFPASNHGFVWFSTSPDGRGGQLRASEYAVASERPLLRVDYRP